ncbi:metallophosphoesterase [Vibrio splendidus]
MSLATGCWDANENMAVSETLNVSITGVPEIIVGDQTIIAQASANLREGLRYSWYLNKKLISTESSVDLSYLSDGRYRLELRVKDKVSQTQVQSETQFSVSGRSNKQLYFGYGSLWRYLDDGSAQTKEWTTTYFDDTTWKVGRGLFGYGISAQNTFLTDYGDVDFSDLKPTSYYFRKSLFVDDVSVLKDVYLKMVIDDAAVIYINGIEIARSPYMVSGEITFDTTLPTASRLPNDEFTFILPPEAFVLGENIIAVQVINQSINSSDIAFDAALQVDDIYQGYSDGPYVFYQNDGVIVKSLTSDGLLVQRYNTVSDTKITISLPNELGQFDVTLRGSFTPPPDRYATPNKYFLTSDIEGNIEAFVYLLVEAGIMDEDFNWTYGSGHLYLLGDIFDRGAYVTESLWLLYYLEVQSRAAGGDVHFIMGNHEMMNLYGDFRYLNPRYPKNASYMGKALIELYSENTELGRWLRSKNILEIAGDNLFVHAGFPEELVDRMIDDSISPLNVNNIGREHMVAGYRGGDRDFYLISRFYWDRDVARQELSQQALERGLSALGVQRMFIGHTVFEKPTYLYKDRVLAIDVRHQENYQRDKFVQGLEFINGQYFHFVASQDAGSIRKDMVSSTHPTF